MTSKQRHAPRWDDPIFYINFEPFYLSDVWKDFQKAITALVQRLWVMTYVQKFVGSNPSALYWMDIISQWFVKIVLFVWKDLE